VAEAPRVCVIGKLYEDSFAACVSKAFRALGHATLTIDDQQVPFGMTAPRTRMWWGGALRQFYTLREIVADRISRRVASFRPDLIISVSKTLPPEAMAAMRAATKAVSVFWFPDAVSNLGRQYFLLDEFDLLCFKDPFLVDRIGRVLGLRCAFLPDAARVLAPFKSIPPSVDLLVACNMYPYRLRLLEALQDYRWKIYGNVPDWLESPVLEHHTRRYLSGDAKVQAYREAAVVFNSNHPAEVGGINARTFEVCGAGGFLLTDAHPALHEYYEPGVEVGVYSDIDDLASKVRFYLDRPELRRQMAERAHARTLREHTYECRIRRLLTFVDMSLQ
jgi:spore maturation protein CgeB